MAGPCNERKITGVDVSHEYNGICESGSLEGLLMRSPNIVTRSDRITGHEKLQLPQSRDNLKTLLGRHRRLTIPAEPPAHGPAEFKKLSSGPPCAGRLERSVRSRDLVDDGDRIPQPFIHIETARAAGHDDG